jgi:hypothetical protein
MGPSLDRFDHSCVSATLEARVRAPGIAQVCGRIAWFVWLALLPLALGVYVVQSLRNGHSAWAIDFNGNFRAPAQEILDGHSPYHPVELAQVHAAVVAGHSPIEYHHGVFAAYPAPGLLVGVPFTALPVVLAEWLWIGCLLAAGGLALRLAGVRDWRVYAAALVMPPVVGSLFYGAVDLLLLLGLAACWRWRDSAGKAGCALGAIIALKLIALPLVLWFVATRRWRAAGLSLVVAGTLAVAGWAVVGFGEITSYPHVLSLLTDIESARGFSAVAFATASGAGASTAAWAPYVAGAALLVALFAVARRGPSADAATFLLGVLAALAFSPIVWQHSIVLLLAPLAVLRPRFGLVWTLPLLLWFAPDTAGVVPASQLILFALVVGAVCAAALRVGLHPPERSRPRPPESITLA